MMASESPMEQHPSLGSGVVVGPWWTGRNITLYLCSEVDPSRITRIDVDDDFHKTVTELPALDR
ncbi:hypothetical protein [Caldimonas sp. KR1-144]|uniref:hypothetical protein n=1 Tax=Caldimonas sp. KR1-144 TaxID=3400911 RepID=UPI003C11A907